MPPVLEVEVDPQSVKMLHFCLENVNAEQPYDVGFHCEEETETLLIFWKYPSKPYCIDSFDLEFSLNGFFWDFKCVEKTMSLNNFHFEFFQMTSGTLDSLPVPRSDEVTHTRLK